MALVHHVGSRTKNGRSPAAYAAAPNTNDARPSGIDSTQSYITPMISPAVAPISDPYNVPAVTANNNITGSMTSNGRTSFKRVVCNPSNINDTNTSRVQRLAIIRSSLSLTVPFVQ